MPPTIARWSSPIVKKFYTCHLLQRGTFPAMMSMCKIGPLHVTLLNKILCADMKCSMALLTDVTTI